MFSEAKIEPLESPISPDMPSPMETLVMEPSLLKTTADSRPEPPTRPAGDGDGAQIAVGVDLGALVAGVAQDGAVDGDAGDFAGFGHDAAGARACAADHTGENFDRAKIAIGGNAGAVVAGVAIERSLMVTPARLPTEGPISADSDAGAADDAAPDGDLAHVSGAENLGAVIAVAAVEETVDGDVAQGAGGGGDGGGAGAKRGPGGSRRREPFRWTWRRRWRHCY